MESKYCMYVFNEYILVDVVGLKFTGCTKIINIPLKHDPTNFSTAGDKDLPVYVNTLLVNENA